MGAFLTVPTEEYKDRLIDFRDEILETDAKIEGSSNLLRYKDINDWLEHIRLHGSIDTVPAGEVPATQYIYVREEDGKIVGVTQLRHYLDRSLAMYFGHIGYGIRPSERRKGYATAMLHELLDICRQRGMDRVMISCLADNEASRRTILNNGGVLEETVWMPSREVYIEKYWITL
ncbi:MAG: GNAT family N-acetyltransferase [Oscillospiraceae bacterium]|nr:GNAT family N-acetyltransferase [Oscillospiraceae bacterium]